MTELQVPTCYRHVERETQISCQRCARPVCPDCMRSAPVGFQCPLCVEEHLNATPMDRAPYGGRRSANPALTTRVLIGINLAVWFAIVATGWKSSQLTDRLALLPTGHCTEGNGFYPGVRSAAVCATRSTTTWHDGVANGAYWQLLTSAFTHIEGWHIASNMLTLWFIGPVLESALGRTRFLAVYLVSALSSSVLVYWISDAQSFTLGASGAGFGMLGALVLISRKVRGDTRFAMRWLGINLFATLAMWKILSWQGHLGGLLGGLLATSIVLYAPQVNRARVQAAGLGAILLLLAVAVVGRSAALA